MVSLKIYDVKEFMNLLLKTEILDDLICREVVVCTFTCFTITCDHLLDDTRKFCNWQELRPVVFDLLKGKNKPLKMKMVFCLTEEKTRIFDENAKILFTNVNYTNEDGIIVTTSYSPKEFTLDKSKELLWDEAVESKIKSLNIALAKN